MLIDCCHGSIYSNFEPQEFRYRLCEVHNLDFFYFSALPKPQPHATMFLFLNFCVLVTTVQSAPLWLSVCQGDHPASHHPFCDSALPLDKRVDDYVARIPIEQQIAMMSYQAAGYDELGIPPYQWWSEGLHGPLEPCVEWKNETRCATSFPCPSGLGNAFNSTLYHQIGTAIGIEGRAISQLRSHNMDIGDGLTYWSPNVNLQRDPRWGRNQEGTALQTCWHMSLLFVKLPITLVSL